MAYAERLPLLDEKVGHAYQLQREDDTFQNSTKSAERSLSDILRHVVLLPLLCGFAIYGSYTFCRQHLIRDTMLSVPAHESSTSFNYTCLPGQACWPTMNDWNAFNQSINGNLRLTVPWAASCYSDPSSTQCQEVAKNYGDGISRTNHYGSMEFLDWEKCDTSQCALNSFNTSEPVSGTCSLGRLSSYHVKADAGHDISKTLHFVRKHGIRVSIKNTGHDVSFDCTKCM